MRWLRGFAAVILIVLGAMLCIPLLYKDTLVRKVVSRLNENLSSELSYVDSDLSFFRHFPSFTLSLHEITLGSAPPFAKDTLLKAKELGLGINVLKLVTSGVIDVEGIYLNTPEISVQIDPHGKASYSIYRKNPSVAKDSLTQDKEVDFHLRMLEIQNAGLQYDDRANGFQFRAKGMNYKGQGHYVNGDARLRTKAEIDSIDLYVGDRELFRQKYIKAQLVTSFKSESTSLVFEKNQLKINDFPLRFQGVITFLSSGYDIQLSAETRNTELSNLISSMPPALTKWKEATKLHGKLNADLVVRGTYDVLTNRYPDILASISLKDGFISSRKSNVPLKDIDLNAFLQLPNSDIGQAQLTIDTLSFSLQDETWGTAMVLSAKEGKPTIHSLIKGKVNLKQFSNTLSVPGYALGGILNTDILLSGKWDPNNNLFPSAKGKLIWSNGSLSTPYYAKPVSNIEVKASLENPKDLATNAILRIDQARMELDGSPFEVKGRIVNFQRPEYEFEAKGTLLLGKLYQAFKQEGMDVDGSITADFFVKGKSDFSETTASNDFYYKGNLELDHVNLQSDYFPHPWKVESGRFTFDTNNLVFQNVSSLYQDNRISTSGYIQNAVNAVMFPGNPVRGKIEIRSPRINLNDFGRWNQDRSDDSISSVISRGEPKDRTVIAEVESSKWSHPSIPPLWDLEIQLEAEKMIFDNLHLKRLSGSMHIKEGAVFIKETEGELLASQMRMSAVFKPASEDYNAWFHYDVMVKNADVQMLWDSIAMVRTLAPAAKDVEGLVGVTYSLEGELDSLMNPVLPSLRGEGVLGLTNVQVKDMKLFSAVSRKTNQEMLVRPQLGGIEIHSSLARNVLEIEPFKMRIKGFRLKAEGQTSLNGELNLKMRIGLPPFGIIGIPVKISGHYEDPSVKLGKRSPDLDEVVSEDPSLSIFEKNRLVNLKHSASKNLSEDEWAALAEEIRQDSLGPARPLRLEEPSSKITATLLTTPLTEVRNEGGKFPD